MKKCINSVLYEGTQATKIVEVDAGIGNRKLYISRHNKFFSLENDSEIVPCTKQEALDFLRIYQPKIDALKFKQILNVHFGLNEQIVNPLKGSLKFAEPSETKDLPPRKAAKKNLQNIWKTQIQ